jgi:hypothetical protein
MKKNYVTYQIDDFFLFDDEVISYENDATQSDKHLLFRNHWETAFTKSLWFLYLCTHYVERYKIAQRVYK